MRVSRTGVSVSLNALVGSPVKAWVFLWALTFSLEWVGEGAHFPVLLLPSLTLSGHGLWDSFQFPEVGFGMAGGHSISGGPGTQLSLCPAPVPLFWGWGGGGAVCLHFCLSGVLSSSPASALRPGWLLVLFSELGCFLS